MSISSEGTRYTDTNGYASFIAIEGCVLYLVSVGTTEISNGDMFLVAYYIDNSEDGSLDFHTTRTVQVVEPGPPPPPPPITGS